MVSSDHHLQTRTFRPEAWVYGWEQQGLSTTSSFILLCQHLDQKDLQNGLLISGTAMRPGTSLLIVAVGRPRADRPGLNFSSAAPLSQRPKPARMLAHWLEAEAGDDPEAGRLTP